MRSTRRSPRSSASPRSPRLRRPETHNELTVEIAGREMKWKRCIDTIDPLRPPFHSTWRLSFLYVVGLEARHYAVEAVHEVGGRGRNLGLPGAISAVEDDALWCGGRHLESGGNKQELA